MILTRIIMLFISTFVLVLGAATLMLLFNRRFEEVVSILLCGIMLLLFLFYVCNLLLAGWIISVLFCLAGGITTIAISIRREGINSLLDRMNTPGFWVFILAGIAICLVSSKNTVYLWDELRLWGALPKALFYTNELQLGEKALIFSSVQSYPPGIELLEYFWLRLNGQFSEMNIYVMYALFGLSMMISPLSRIPMKKKNIWKIPFLACVLFVLPLLVYNNIFPLDSASYYTTLYIDPLMGICYFYLVYSILDFDFHAMPYSLLRFSLGAAAISLLKDTGVLFALLSIIGLYFRIHANRDQMQTVKKKKGTFSLGLTAIPLSSTLTFWLIWKLRMYASGIKQSQWLAGSISESSIQMLKKCFNRIFLNGLIQTRFTLLSSVTTIAGIITALMLVILVLCLLVRSHERKALCISSAILLLSNVVYMTFVIFFYAIVGWDELFSIERYLFTLILGDLCYVTAVLIRFSHTENVKNRKAIGVFAICFFSTFLLIAPFLSLMQSSDATTIYQNGIADAKVVKTAIEADRLDGHRVNLFLVESEEHADTRRHHRLAFELMDDEIKIMNYFTQTVVITSEDTDKEASAARWGEWLLEGNCEYVFILDADENFKRYCGAFFTDQSQIDNYSMYKVEASEAKICLIKVQ